jgi:cobalt-zinc-cadmium efflux system membrane fusion protein
MSFKGAHVRIIAAVLFATAAGFAIAQVFDPHRSDSAEPHGEEHGDEHAEAGEEAFIQLKREDAANAGVEIVGVERGGGVDLILPGRVSVAVTAQSIIGAPLDGTIIDLHVSTGSRIAKGAPVATIRSPEGGAIRAEVDAARASLNAADALDVRTTSLFEQGAVPRQEWEATRAATLTAQANVRAAEAKAAAMGSPNASGAAVIRSPIAGVVTNIAAAPGAVLDDGMPIVTVADATDTELVFDAPPATLGLIAVGARIEAQWTGGQKVLAEVTGVAPGGTGYLATVRARLLTPAPPPGTIISGRLIGVGGDVLTVPSDAVQSLDGVSSVFVLEPKGFHATTVVTGRVSNGRTEIVSGLTGEEEIAGSGSFLLKAELGKGEAEHDH